MVEFVEDARRVRTRHPEVRFQRLGAVGAAKRSAIDAGTVAGWMGRGGGGHLATLHDARPAITVV